jgi:hypothetical protein
VRYPKQNRTGCFQSELQTLLKITTTLADNGSGTTVHKIRCLLEKSGHLETCGEVAIVAVDAWSSLIKEGALKQRI